MEYCFTVFSSSSIADPTTTLDLVTTIIGFCVVFSLFFSSCILGFKLWFTRPCSISLKNNAVNRNYSYLLWSQLFAIIHILSLPYVNNQLNFLEVKSNEISCSMWLTAQYLFGISGWFLFLFLRIVNRNSLNNDGWFARWIFYAKYLLLISWLCLIFSIASIAANQNISFFIFENQEAVCQRTLAIRLSFAFWIIYSLFVIFLYYYGYKERILIGREDIKITIILAAFILSVCEIINITDLVDSIPFRSLSSVLISVLYSFTTLKTIIQLTIKKDSKTPSEEVKEFGIPYLSKQEIQKITESDYYNHYTILTDKKLRPSFLDYYRLKASTDLEFSCISFVDCLLRWISNLSREDYRNPNANTTDNFISEVYSPFFYKIYMSNSNQIKNNSESSGEENHENKDVELVELPKNNNNESNVTSQDDNRDEMSTEEDIIEELQDVKPNEGNYEYPTNMDFQLFNSNFLGTFEDKKEYRGAKAIPYFCVTREIAEDAHSIMNDITNKKYSFIMEKCLQPVFLYMWTKKGREYLQFESQDL